MKIIHNKAIYYKSKIVYTLTLLGTVKLRRIIQIGKKEYLKDLFEKWYQSESSHILDEEDLSRAELRREVLFYHQVGEEFLNFFLQALYALNHCYFPSRKRTEMAIMNFSKKPINCYERLMNVVKYASDENKIEQSVVVIRSLTKELKELLEKM